ncbi:conserved hypothetical protein [Listeria seeligeri FSL N1-067]|uniref:Uncharacterized protein n=1 Tax=Listeria seeligeri FSL N1-067 TaxID=702453 RepID=E3ZMH3_LISSE|nr:conserved hypothetical protein [Listeria seeligeri FSL N1-067]
MIYLKRIHILWYWFTTPDKDVIPIAKDIFGSERNFFLY